MMAPQYTTIDSLTDLILLLMRANEERGRAHFSGTTRLQKLVFLITQSPAYQALEQKQLAPQVRFEPYRMGPFNPDIYEAIQVLTDFEPPLLSARASSSEQDSLELGHYAQQVALDAIQYGTPRPATFNLTPAGKRVADRLWEDADPALRDEITTTMRGFGALPLRDLLRRVYQMRPDMTTRSEIRESLGLGDSKEP